MATPSNISAIRKAYDILSENAERLGDCGMTDDKWFDFLVDLNIAAMALERLTKQPTIPA